MYMRTCASASFEELVQVCLYPPPSFFPTLPEFLRPFSHSHGGVFPTTLEFFWSFPIPAYVMKKTPWVSVKIFHYLQREFSVVCKGIFQQRAEKLCFFYVDIWEENRQIGYMGVLSLKPGTVRLHLVNKNTESLLKSLQLR
jgi:hypothetical protein